MIGYQNSRLRFLRLLISRFGLVWLGISKSRLLLPQIVGYLVGYQSLIFEKNVPFFPITSRLRFAAVVYPT